MDCDAFYASVEKRDNPDLEGKPLIIGGGRRGVVSTACYVARIKGVKSAMPMFQALKLCPDAIVVKPRFEAYTEASRAIRALMDELTPIVEPLSLDEAFMDMTGTARLHGAPPAVMLARLVKRMKDEVGLTGSIGLSHNKFLAKVASDLQKPRGFSIIGKEETTAFLRPKSVRLIWGIGPVAQDSLNKAGIQTFDDLLRWDRRDLYDRFGGMGERLYSLARGEDGRRISSHTSVKGLSNETTFNEDTADLDILDGHLWRMAEKVSARAKATHKAGRVVTLKLKSSDFKLISKRQSLHHPTQMADKIYRTARGLFDQVSNRGPFRLLGVGISEIGTDGDADREGDLLDPGAEKRAEAERAADKIREKFGADAIIKGRALR
jgi:DNA polymerase-4